MPLPFLERMGKTSEFHIIERSRTELGWLNDESDTLNAPDFDHDFFHSIVASSVAVTVTSHYGVPKVRRASASNAHPPPRFHPNRSATTSINVSNLLT